MPKALRVEKRALEIIQIHALQDMEDIIHDITGAPVEELLRLGVDREAMLAAANETMRAIRGE